MNNVYVDIGIYESLKELDFTALYEIGTMHLDRRKIWLVIRSFYGYVLSSFMLTLNIILIIIEQKL